MSTKAFSDRYFVQGDFSRWKVKKVNALGAMMWDQENTEFRLGMPELEFSEIAWETARQMEGIARRGTDYGRESRETIEGRHRKL